MSAKQVTGAIGIRHSRVAQISATKQVQNLTGQGLQVADFSPEKLVCSDSGNISGYTLEVASVDRVNPVELGCWVNTQRT